MDAKNNPDNIEHIHDIVQEETQETFGFLNLPGTDCIAGSQAGQESQSGRGEHASQGIDKEGNRKGPQS